MSRPRLGVPVRRGVATLCFCLLCSCPALHTTTDRRDEPDDRPESVSYSSGKDTVRALLSRPPGTGPFPAVVVVHGDYGRTEAILAHAQRLTQHGYVALAVDLYRGEVAGDLMDAHILGRGLPDDRVLADLKGAVDYLSGRPDVRREALGILGWDMGGGYALDAAVQDARLRAVVTCCGRLTTDPAALEPMKASVLGLFAGEDEGITADTRSRFEATMRRAGKRLAGMHVYAESRPGFMDQPQSDPAIDAWHQIVAYLAEELR